MMCWLVVNKDKTNKNRRLALLNKIEGSKSENTKREEKADRLIGTIIQKSSSTLSTGEDMKGSEDNTDTEIEYFEAPYKIPWGIVIFTFILILCVGVFTVYSAVSKDFNRKDWIENPSTITIHVDKGANLSEITDDLKESGLIKYDILFNLYTSYISGKSSKIQYGDFEFTSNMSYDDIISILCMQSVFTETIQVTIPEGLTAVAIAQIMEDNGLCTVDEFLDCANGDDGSDWSQYEFWNLIPSGTQRIMKCEGYLFPDTYEFYVGDDVYNLVDKFYKQFDSKVDSFMMDVDDSEYTLDELVILGSFIQEEAGRAEEDYKVSAVFHNRLESSDPLWSEHKLESNTCSYIRNSNENNYLWNSPTAEYMGWVGQGEIPDEILEIYDTYTISGLPAGPVSNPGIDAIKAALYPDSQYIEDEYYFFVTGKPGTDVAGQYFYAKTASEHQKNVELAGWA